MLRTNHWMWIVGLFLFTWQQERLWSQSALAVDDLPTISESVLRAHLRFLADDLLEGRGPGTRGDALTQLYLATQFESLGLKPIPKMGGWIQPVPLVGTTTAAPKELRFQSNSESVSWRYFDDYIAVTGKPVESVELAGREIVFVGYGIQAPEYDWDDFKDADLEGKILLVMNNDPASDPNLFAGKKRLYYGRWDYKYESAARQKAAGAIIIHTTESAGYPFQVIQTSWTGEEVELRDDIGPRLQMRSWATNDACKKLCELAGYSLDELRARAEMRDFRPVPLGVRLDVSLQAVIRPFESGNVLGMIEGSDPKLKDEYVIFMAHHDHLGRAATRNEKGDDIYNGAIDNASGTATLLAIADYFNQNRVRPKRSILFAAVAAEESGLLGSRYFASFPPIPPGKMSAVLNIDGINFLGRSKDVNVIGDGKSNLDALIAEAAKRQNRVVVPDTSPDKGYYYRSDQFSLAKVGVPGVYLHSGIAIVGRPDGWGKQQIDAWTERDYHQPSDEYDPNWNLEGALEDAQLLAWIGLQIAEGDELPAWNQGDEFEAARKKALEEAARSE